MKIGVDYYPEHWDRTMWADDARKMHEANITIVRVAEFAWSRLEPTEGNYQFDWLDDAISTFYERGISVVIGTPTCTPPNWLVEKCPDILPVDAQLHPTYPGVRGHRCHNSPSLRTFTERIVERLTKHYATNPAVIGWQTDNEFYPMMCHCDACAEKFRAWVKVKYGSLENLNREWGTVVWSGEFSRWEEIKPPLGGSKWLNPSYLLDFKRFQGDSVIEYHQSQVDIIRKNCPGHFVTHNTHGFPQPMDLEKLYANTDFVSYDYYPNTDPGKVETNGYSGALALDICRGAKRKNFWIMEQLSGPPGCWFPTWRAPYPGFMRAFGWHSIARGADAVIQFRWRSATIGAEQFWHGLIDHSNVPGYRFQEFTQFSAEVTKLSERMADTTIQNQVAILFDYEQYIALSMQPQADGMDAYENLKTYHRALLKLGMGTDVIHSLDNLQAYDLLVVPSMYLLDRTSAKMLEDFARQGGTLIIANRTGVKNRQNVCWMEPLPGPLAHCIGAVVEDYDPVGQHVHTVTINHRSYEANQWCDILKPTTADVIGWYGSDFYSGKPAITRNQFGNGSVYYVGANLEEVFYRDLFRQIASERGLSVFPGLPDGVQISIRKNGRESFLFILNLTREPQSVVFSDTVHSVLTDTRIGQTVHLDAYGVDILSLGSETK